jgi:hypothetical protein
MPPRHPLHRRARAALLLAVFAPLLGACEHAGFGSADGHFATFGVTPPSSRTVEVCHAYGCRKRTRFTFRSEDIAELGAIMARTRTADTPAEERRAVAYAVGWIEHRVGKAIGTDKDRPGMDFEASGDPTQQDCVDEATNTTSYLTVLHNAGLLRHHRVGTPFARENYLRGISGWTHWTAVLEETAPAAGNPAEGTRPGQRWAVDSWIYANGENPAVVEAEKWYIAGLDELPTAMR